jgi:hypothetical protein
MHDPMVYYFVWILTPVVPAYAMFKWLPSDVTATGPFKGMKWKLGGAFAGYFLIVLISMEYVSDLKTTALNAQAEKLAAAQAELGEPWTIIGQIHKTDGTVPIETKFLTQPQYLDIRSDGGFSVQVLLPRRKPADVLPPDLLINCEHYLQETVSLQWENEAKPQFAIGGTKYNAARDSVNHTIIINPAIVLEPEPASPYKQ